MTPSPVSGTWYVATNGTDSAGVWCELEPVPHDREAVTNAAPGSRVKVLRGTYPEMVTITKPLTLTGTDATIDATGKDNGVLVGPGASGVQVMHLRVVNATGEGILATQVDGVRLFFNHVEHNDRGVTVANTYPSARGKDRCRVTVAKACTSRRPPTRPPLATTYRTTPVASS